MYICFVIYLSICKDNYFLFYQPKDVVSGDFYWSATTITSHTKRPLGIFAVIDCTGHGVPGAFMSMLTNTLLNQTVKDPEINSPAEVLNFLNRELPENLKSKGCEIRDGMDISLCTIDLESKELSFAGANNSGLIIRKNQSTENGIIQNPIFIELKADKQAISACIDKEKKNFSNQKVFMQKGDILYLFTDGYADQFGGSNNKKFMRNNLKKLLLSIYQLPLKKQQDILKQRFEEWKGVHEQIDDVLVMGITF